MPVVDVGTEGFEVAASPPFGDCAAVDAGFIVCVSAGLDDDTDGNVGGWKTAPFGAAGAEATGAAGDAGGELAGADFCSFGAMAYRSLAAAGGNFSNPSGVAVSVLTGGGSALAAAEGPGVTAAD